jgi:hypothetical protein
MLRRSQASVTVNLPCGTEATRYFSYFPTPCTKSEKPSVESFLLLNNRFSDGDGLIFQEANRKSFTIRSAAV